MIAQFAHLHVHTEYSLLDGAAKIDALFTEAARLGQPAVAMTDHGNMFGAYFFHQAAKKYGVKPIIGIEAYLAPDDRRHRESVYWGTEEQRSVDVGGSGAYTHLTLLAKNAAGLRNLFRLSSLASLEGRYRKPRMDLELLSQYGEGVIATTGCPGSEVCTRLRLGQPSEALAAAAALRDIVGPDNYYLELMDHGMALDRELRPGLLELGRRLKLPPLATNDSHYVTADQACTHDALLCVQTGAKLADADRFRFEGEGYHLRSAGDMRALFDTEVPGACDNTLTVAERVGSYDEVFAPVNRMPRFPLPAGETEDSWLRQEVKRGMAWRFLGGGTPDRRKRMEYELGVITTMGFAGYFLVVADLVRWAKTRGIRVGPGRGSAAGSIVAYALGITSLDPIKHELLFERFLNPDRIAPPDIDLDFDERRRDEVIGYLTERYGADRVGRVVSYSTIRAKAAIKDAARVLGAPYVLGEQLSKAFPEPISGFDEPLTVVTDPGHDRYREAAGFRQILDAEPGAQQVYDTALGLQGLTRQASVHPCGVILANEPLIDVLPLWQRDDGSVITGWDYPVCEAIGLLKIDALGLRNLTIIDDAIAGIAATTGKTVDLDAVPLDDAATFAMLTRGDSLGVFQLDSPPMQALLRRVAPTRLGDLAAAVAIYRPGPLATNTHNEYADRKNRRKPLKPIHPELAAALAPILDDTYGLLVYQEQVVKIAVALAGYTASQGDLLRKAMGKKKPEILAKEGAIFAERMTGRGFSSEATKKLWDTVVPFAAYGFNLAHATCYGLLGYWTAYLKANYPVEYMAALLTSVSDDHEKMAVYLAEVRGLGIRVLPPCINESGHHFTPTDGVIRFGLGAVRNLGTGVVEAILQARAVGPFTGIADFLLRTGAGKRAVESLAAAGAFDSLGVTRRGLSEVAESAVHAVAALRKLADVAVNYVGDPVELPELSLHCGAEEWPATELLAREREALGLYVSSHPLAGAEPVLAEARGTTIAPLRNAVDDGEVREVRIAGLLATVTKKVTRNGGQPWAVLGIEDQSGAIDVLTFPRTYTKCRNLLRVDSLVAVTGRLHWRDAQVSVVADEIKSLNVSQETLRTEPVTLRMGRVDETVLIQLRAVLAAHPGVAPVRLELAGDVVLELSDYQVADCERFRRDVAAAFGCAEVTPQGVPISSSLDRCHLV